MGSINGMTTNYLQSILNATLQNTRLAATQAPANATSTDTNQTDTNQLSPLARILSTLQQLQQSDPSKYQQVTQQIAANLQAAAQTAARDGNTKGASELTQLATDFTNASKTGQLPSIQDLAEAMGGGSSHGRQHHHHSGNSSNPANAQQIIAGTLSGINAT